MLWLIPIKVTLKYLPILIVLLLFTSFIVVLLSILCSFNFALINALAKPPVYIGGKSKSGSKYLRAPVWSRCPCVIAIPFTLDLFRFR